MNRNVGEDDSYNRSHNYCLGVRFSKDPKTLRARKAIRKTPTRLFCKAGLFICCKGNNITAKFRDTEHLHFENTKRIMSPEKFRVFGS